ncbi:MAG: hypothetical protein ACO3HA_10460, partial [Burkholderiales bacterium]
RTPAPAGESHQRDQRGHQNQFENQYRIQERLSAMEKRWRSRTMLAGTKNRNFKKYGCCCAD